MASLWNHCKSYCSKRYDQYTSMIFHVYNGTARPLAPILSSYFRYNTVINMQAILPNSGFPTQVVA